MKLSGSVCRVPNEVLKGSDRKKLRSIIKVMGALSFTGHKTSLEFLGKKIIKNITCASYFVTHKAGLKIL